jgi:hypothetical protein
MDAVQEFEIWSNTKLNMAKTVVMSINGGSGEKDPPPVTYKQQTIKVFQATESCRHLGYWNGDMTNTKRRVLEKTREVLGLLTYHPLETKTAKELFQSMAVSVFRFSAARLRWSQAEFDQLQSLWTQAYKRAEYLPNGTASDVSVLPKKWGKSYPHRSISSPRNFATTSEGAWCTMTWRSLLLSRNFKEPRRNLCVIRLMNYTTRWSYGSGMKYNIIGGREL